ncbi:MAG TPA: hypothetical protein VE569_10540 [Acidimicrobiia bacterium]|nr:hypothetical protein [Acidimicrobiia bacterium]
MLRPYPSDEQIEALIKGEDPEDLDLIELEILVDAIRSLGDREIGDDIAARHVAMIAGEASVSPCVDWFSEPVRSARAPRTRRRLVLSSLLSSILAKVLAASVAVAAVGTGLGVAANNAVPGDALFGLNQAMEKIGLIEMSPAEQIEQAQSLVDIDLPEAVTTAGQAVESAGHEEAAGALFQAAERIRGVEAEQSEEIREAVASLLELIGEQLAADGVVGADVAEAAQAIGDSVTLPPQVPTEIPPADLPTAGDDHRQDPGDVTPGDVPPDDVPPDNAGNENSENPPTSPPTTQP